MKYMQLFLTRPGTVLRMKMRKAVFCLALLLPLGLLTACSDDDPADDPTPEPDTVQVLSTNGRMPSGGTLSSQYADSPAGCGIDKIVDNNNNTKFATNHAAFSIRWEGYESVSVNYYSLTSADDAEEKDPKSWTLSGSTDNTTWDVLDVRTDQTFASRKEKKEFEFINKKSYKFLKLEVTANNGGSATQIAELSIRRIVLSIDDLMKYSSGSTYDDNNPMGKNFLSLPATTDEMRQKLADPQIEPPVFGDFSYYDFSGRVRLYPTAGEPSPCDANQHAVGDCCAIAVFGCFAYSYPDFIKSLITDNGDDTYSVAMYDPKGKSITVGISSKFFADGNGSLGAVSGKNNVACWSTVLEKAMIKWSWIYRGSPDVGGIATENVACLFTGDGGSFAFDRGVLDNDQLARAVKISLQNGQMVVGGWSPGGIPVDGTETVSAHAYTFMFSKQIAALFAMRNPWGGNPNVDGSADGIINIPDNLDVPPLIDLRILEPGRAANYWNGVPEAYTPPAFSPAMMKMRVSEELMRTGR